MRWWARAATILLVLAGVACGGPGGGTDPASDPGPSDVPGAGDPGDAPSDTPPGDLSDIAGPGLDSGPDTPDADVPPAPLASWQGVGLAPGVPSSALWVNGPSDAWLVALVAQGVLHWDGQAWSRQDGPRAPGSGAAAVWSPGPGGAWVDGFRWGGQAWGDGFGAATKTGLRALWGSGPTDVWAVPGGEDVGRWDGTAWTRKAPLPDADWTSLHGTGPADVWVAGAAKASPDAARVAHWDGKAWSDRSAGLGWPVRRIRATADGAWACSATGRLAWWDGQWHDVASPLVRCTDLWVSPGGLAWMVDSGDDDQLAVGSPTGWIRLVTGIPNRFSALSGTATETWVATLTGSVYRLDRSACGDAGATDECCGLGFARCRLDACGLPAAVTETCDGACPGCPPLCLPKFRKGCCGCPDGCTATQCAAGEGSCRYASACWQDACGGAGEVIDACKATETCVDAQCVCASTCAGRCGIPDTGCGGTCQCAAAQACCDGTCSDDLCCGACAPGETCSAGRCCTQSCEGRVCGGDGCGGLCGTCPAGETCCNDHCSTDPSCGRCAADEFLNPFNGLCCRPDCGPGRCGWDRCVGTCGDCPAGQACCMDGLCHADGCCGECPQGQVCAGEGMARSCCTPSCAGRACGDDGCGGSCGTCAAGTVCDPQGACSPDACGGCAGAELCIGRDCCQPRCLGVPCGDDGCGGDCGACPDGQVCVRNQCCTPACDGRTCGDDGCGGSCGTCPEGEGCCWAVGTCGAEPCCGLCTADQVCVGGYCCTPSCQDKTCGGDGCGGTCGTCADGQVCLDGGKAATCCSTACGGRECGPDTCGGVCGTCAEGETCCDGQCRADACCGACGPDRACIDGRKPMCVDPTCGDAVCGEGVGTTCGLCPLGLACQNGRCVPPGCEDRECGVAPDGTWCGECAAGQGCDDLAGRCVTGLGGCGACEPGQVCVDGVACCTPHCDGRECGPDPDGCGTSCGTCPAGLACLEGACGDPCAGQCTGGKACDHGVCRCLPRDHATCGPDGASWWVDGCGGVGEKLRDCPLGCQDGRCLGCTPDCTGRVCGDDGCGGSCGDCGPGRACFDPPGAVPECRVRRGLQCCGDALCWHFVDPFGSGTEWTSTYGTCAHGCLEGWCIDCVPQSCDGRQCGDDGCGWPCGACKRWERCLDGACVPR